MYDLVPNTPARRLAALALFMAENPQALISHSVDKDGELSITASIKGQFFTAGFDPSEQGIAEDGEPILISRQLSLQKGGLRKP